LKVESCACLTDLPGQLQCKTASSTLLAEDELATSIMLHYTALAAVGVLPSSVLSLRKMIKHEESSIMC